MNRIYRIFPLIIVAILALTAFDCKKEENRYGGIADGTYQNKIRDRGNQIMSPLGMRIDGYNDVPASYIAEYDAGATDLFSVVTAAPYNYTANVTHGNYKVYVFPRSRHCQTAGFAIPGGWNEWDQTEFDKDPRQGKTLICAAGLNFGHDTLVVAADLGIARVIVNYELEHFVLRYNDEDWYNRTVGVHAHPLFRSAALATDKRFTPWMLELPEDVTVNGVTAKKGTRICVLIVK